MTTYNITQTHVINRTSRAKPRVYFTQDRESIMENLINRRSRPHLVYKSMLRDALLDAGYTTLDAQTLARNARWSQKAGCACGCSPGFILHTSWSGFDVFVTIADARAPSLQSMHVFEGA